MAFASDIDIVKLGGYQVKIIGGELYTTFKGDHYVEMKSGTQYKIWAFNGNLYGCHLDITIDGYKMGTWIIDPREDITLERPASMAKRFTFYRVETAPKEAGIASGRKENGVVECVFTPDKEGIEAMKRRELERIRRLEEEAVMKVHCQKEIRYRFEREQQKKLNEQRIITGHVPEPMWRSGATTLQGRS
ncbi:uncharacterized protein LOC144652055 [Oculina patagonica]